MGMWKYKYLPQNSTEIREGYLNMIDDDDRLAVVEKIQELRIALAKRGCRFVEAGPVNGAEKAIAARLESLKRFKKPHHLTPRLMLWRWLVRLFLLILLLLILLVLL